MNRRLFLIASALALQIANVGTAQASVFENLQDSIRQQSAQWFSQAFAYADALFFLVGAVTITLAFARYAARNRTVAGFGETAVEMMIGIGIPLTILRSAHTGIPMLVDSMAGTASSVAGVPVSTTTPDGVFTTGLTLAGSVVTHACKGAFLNILPAPLQSLAGSILGANSSQTNASLNNAATSNFPGTGIGIGAIFVVVGLLAAAFIVIMFTIIATELLFAFAQAYVTAAIGAVQLGWSAAEGTSSWASAYWSAIMASFIRLTVTYAVIAVGQKIAANWESTLLSSSPATLLNDLFMLVGSSLGYMLIVGKMTTFATNLLTGHPVASAQGAVRHVPGVFGGAAQNVVRGVGTIGGMVGRGTVHASKRT